MSILIPRQVQSKSSARSALASSPRRQSLAATVKAQVKSSPRSSAARSAKARRSSSPRTFSNSTSLAAPVKASASHLRARPTNYRIRSLATSSSRLLKPPTQSSSEQAPICVPNSRSAWSRPLPGSTGSCSHILMDVAYNSMFNSPMATYYVLDKSSRLMVKVCL